MIANSGHHQFSIFLNWTLTNIFRENLNQNIIISIQQNAFEKRRLQNGGHFFKPQCVERIRLLCLPEFTGTGGTVLRTDAVLDCLPVFKLVSFRSASNEWNPRGSCGAPAFKQLARTDNKACLIKQLKCNHKSNKAWRPGRVISVTVTRLENHNWKSGTRKKTVLIANMGPIWGRQDPGGPHVGPMNFAIWGSLNFSLINSHEVSFNAALCLSMKMFAFSFKFHWSLFQLGPFNDKGKLVQAVAWRRNRKKTKSPEAMLS